MYLVVRTEVLVTKAPGTRYGYAFSLRVLQSRDAPLKSRGLGEGVQVFTGEALPATATAAASAAAAAATAVAASCVGCSSAQHDTAQPNPNQHSTTQHSTGEHNIRQSDPTRSDTILVTVVRSQQYDNNA